MSKAAAERLARLLGDQLVRQGLNAVNGPPFALTVAALRERSQTLLEKAERAHCYYKEYGEFDALSAKTHLTNRRTAAAVGAARGVREPCEWSEASTQSAVESVATKLGLKLGKLAQPLRVALTGRSRSSTRLLTPRETLPRLPAVARVGP